MNLVAELQKVEEFKDLPIDRLEWLAENSELKVYQKGDFVFKSGDPMDNLTIILNGKCVFKVKQENNFRVLGTLEAYSITGLLPFSRATHAKGYGEITEKSHVLSLHKSHFRHMNTHFEDLTTILVHLMSTRIRTFTKSQQQNEKMLSLGKLSAGLAHELNNPSAAVVRSANTLRSFLGQTPDKFKEIIALKFDGKQIDVVNDILYAKAQAGIKDLPLMEKTEIEDDIIDFLDDNNVENSDEIAENLTDFGFDLEELEKIQKLLSEEQFSPVMNWIDSILMTERLVGEIEEASKRINDLVGSIKSYTFMDQAPEKKPIDIHEGLNNTLTMLGHKFKKYNIELEKNFDKSLLEAEVLPSTINQVWTNIIDNALDAMKETDNRKLTIETKKNGSFVNVNIQDSGTGIPEKIMDKIFDPFFTTKKIGEGTGLGLEIVHNIITKDHNGSIDVKSKPGQTVFEICFPISAA